MGTVLKRMSKDVLRGSALRGAQIRAAQARAERDRAKLARRAKDRQDRHMALKYGSRRFQKRVYRAAQHFYALKQAGDAAAVSVEEFGKSALRGRSELKNYNMPTPLREDGTAWDWQE